MPKKKQLIKSIAKNRIKFLFNKAHEIFPINYPENKDLANRYVYLARRYAQRARLQIPHHWKYRTCNKCKQFLFPGINCRIRMQSRRGRGTHVSLTCFECNKTTRYFIKTRIKSRRPV